MIRSRTSLFVIVAVLAGTGAFSSFVLAQAPTISNVRIASTTDSAATIEWETDAEADSTVTFGLDPRHGIIRNATESRTDHQLKIDQLDPSTTYFFRVQSTDDEGNQALSQGYTFTTRGIQDIPQLDRVQNQQQKALAQQAITAVRDITDPQALEAVQQTVQQQINPDQEPPSIIGKPRILEVGSDYAIIAWKTDQDATSLVRYATDEQYDGDSANPYTSSQGGSGEGVREHEIRVDGLESATTYHFQVESESVSGNLTSTSDDFTFTTTSVLPRIRNIELSKVQETSATITWTTDVPAAGEVEFTNLASEQTRTAGEEAEVSSHRVRLTDLQFGMTYRVVIRAITETGDEVTSEPFTFTTVRDEAPPEISKVTNESTLFPGEETRIRTLISWTTDEPAKCQLFYQRGVGGSDEIETDPEQEFVTDHVKPITGLSPATVYRYWIECRDDAGNVAESEDFVLFTPAQQKNIIDLIIENFENTFGWVRNIVN